MTNEVPTTLSSTIAPLFQDIAAVGVTNQRETTIVWDKTTGQPLFNAIVWLDMRTSSTVDQLLDTVPNKTRNKNYLKVSPELNSADMTPSELC